jgi:Coenzyme PQQ synthesis protein D (PqqD).
MKCKYQFEKMELDGEIIGVPTGESALEIHSVLNLNEEAMRILELLCEETTEQAVVTQLLEEYDSTEEIIAPLVHAFIVSAK